MITLEKHILECYPQEGCGLLIGEDFIPLENEHPEPANNFSLSEKDSFKVMQAGKDAILMHSHTMDKFTDDPRIPSYEDMVGQKNTGIEWGIVHCDGENVSEALCFGKPKKDDLEGRSYITNVYDCFTLARDYYWQEYKIDFGIHPRPANWEEWNQHYIEQNYKDVGFYQLEKGEPYKKGDIALFSIAANYINHIGVILDGDIFIHHLYNKKSCKDSLSRWHRQLTKVLRYR